MKATVHILLLCGRKEKNRASVCLAQPVSPFAPLEAWAIPHIAPRGSWHLSCGPICVPAGNPQARVRQADRILKIARTLADLDGAATLAPKHVSGAIRCRSLDRPGLG